MEPYLCHFPIVHHSHKHQPLHNIAPHGNSPDCKGCNTIFLSQSSRIDQHSTVGIDGKTNGEERNLDSEKPSDMHSNSLLLPEAFPP
jgi:hypothetical protein